jgi:hypothetical protein
VAAKSAALNRTAVPILPTEVDITKVFVATPSGTLVRSTRHLVWAGMTFSERANPLRRTDHSHLARVVQANLFGACDANEQRREVQSCKSSTSVV